MKSESGFLLVTSTGHTDGFETPLIDNFKYYTQEKVVCGETQQVKLQREVEGHAQLELQIPQVGTSVTTGSGKVVVVMVAAALVVVSSSSKDEGEVSEVRPKIEADEGLREVSFEACLATALGDDVLEDFKNPSLGGRSAPAIKNIRFRSFPNYLVLKLGRYIIGENWVQKKIPDKVAVPETLDLTGYARDGIGHGEVEMSEHSSDGSTDAAMDVAEI